MKQKTKSHKTKAETNGSKVGGKFVANPKGKKCCVQIQTGSENITSHPHSDSTKGALQTVLSALPSSLQKSNFCKKSMDIAAASLKPPPVVASESSAMGPTQATYWASIINENCYRSTAQLLEAGKNLVRAKAKLLHGEWQKLFELIPLSLREAQRLMQVAQHPVLSKTNSCSLLPASPQALSALSQSDPLALQEALTSGHINARTTIAEAKSFQREHPVAGKKAQRGNLQKEFDIDRAVDRCRKIFFEEYHRCPECDRDTFCDFVEGVVNVMKEKPSPSHSHDAPS